jgi:hypothetical protein
MQVSPAPITLVERSSHLNESAAGQARHERALTFSFSSDEKESAPIPQALIPDSVRVVGKIAEKY